MKGLLQAFKRPAGGRTDLKAAIAQRDVAVEALEKARGVIAQMENVIDAAEEANRHAMNADQAAKTSLETWAQAGCDPQGDAEHEKLAAAADEARRIADHRRVAAEAARKGLEPAQAAVARAQSEMESCEREIMKEIGLILVAEGMPDTERGEELAAAYQAWRIEMRGLLAGMESVSTEAAQMTRDAIQRAQAKIERIPDYEHNGRGRWVEFPPKPVLDIAARWRNRAAKAPCRRRKDR